MCLKGLGPRSTVAPRLRDLVRLRRVRDRIDREYAQPLDVETLAAGVNMSPGRLSREFLRAYGETPYSYLERRRIERTDRPRFGATGNSRRCVTAPMVPNEGIRGPGR